MNSKIPVQESMRQIALAPCKLIILYMLSISGEDVSRARIADFILDEDYANYTTMQAAFDELIKGGFVKEYNQDNRTFLCLEESGSEVISYYKIRLHDKTRENIKEYLKRLKVQIRDEASVKAFSRKLANGEFIAELSIKEGDSEMLKIAITAPTEDISDNICHNWQEKNLDIYKYLTKELMK